MLASHQSHPAIRAFLSLPRFWCTRKIEKNREKSLLSMCCMLLGYSFEPRPNSRAMGTAGSVMIIGFAKKKPVWREKTRLTGSKSSGCGDFKELTSMWFRQGLLLFSSLKKTKEGSSRRVHLSAPSTILSIFFLLSFSKPSTFLVLASPVYLSRMYKVCE